MDRFEALKISEFDHLEFAVADLDKASGIFVRLGFERVATREILERQLRSHLFAQNRAYVMLSVSTLRTDPVARFVAEHGDGVFSIGLLCDDAVTALDLAANRGAQVLEAPKMYRKEFGTVITSAVRAFGDVRHTFVSRRGNLFAEGFEVPAKSPRRPAGFQALDTIGCVVDSARLDATTQFYERVLGLKVTRRATDALSLESPDGRLRLRLSHPEGEACAQREFLEINHGPGIHHIAFATETIADTLRLLRKENVRIHAPPPEPDVAARLSEIPFRDDFTPLALQGVRIDGDAKGYLLQAFTGNAFGPVFFEVAQRSGFRSVGDRNLRTYLTQRS